MNLKKIKGVTTRKGKKPGKTVAVFGGVHGNETVGVKMVDILRKELKVKAGMVYLVYGNLPAIKQKQRFVEKNLNRCFQKDNKSNTVEDKRARELMKILDKCDALLDLHSFPNSKGDPFVICEKEAFDIANKFDIPVISFGWGEAEPGATEDYARNNGKIDICIETGSDYDLDKSLDRAKFAVDVFLKYFGCIKGKMIVNKKPKKYVKVYKAIIRKDKNFKFKKDYKNFDTLAEGEVFATEGNKKYIAKKDECIVLSSPAEAVGGEICLLGREIRNEGEK